MSRLNLGQVYVQLAIDAKKLQKGEKEARQSLGRVDTEIKKTKKSALSLGSALGGFIAASTVKDLVLFQDKMIGLNLQIKDLTRNTGDFEQVKQGLIDITFRTGAALESNVALAQNVGRAARDMGKSNQEVLSFIENVNKAAIIGGASATEIKFAQRQLAQAMAATNVRAEELNSIIENTPGLANEIAKGLGMTTSGMRKLMLEGGLESEKVFDAILKQTDEIDSKFSGMPTRVGQATEMMKASWGSFLLRLEESYPVQAMLMNGVANMAEELERKLSGISKETQNWQNRMQGANQTNVSAAAILIKKIEETSAAYERLKKSDSSWLKTDTKEKKKELEELEKIYTNLNSTIKGLANHQALLNKYYDAFDAGKISKEQLDAAEKRYILSTRELKAQKDLMDAEAKKEEIRKKEEGQLKKALDLAFSQYNIGVKKLENQKKILEEALEISAATKEEKALMQGVIKGFEIQISKIKEKNRELRNTPSPAKSELLSLMDQFSTDAEKVNKRFQETQLKIRNNPLLKEGGVAHNIQSKLLLANEKDKSEALKELRERDSKHQIDTAKTTQDKLREIRSLESAYLSPTQAEDVRHQEELEKLQLAQENQIESILSFNEIKLAIEQEHQARLDQIKLDSAIKDKELQLKTVGVYGKAASDIHGIFVKAGKDKTALGKAAFLAMKAMAVAEIIIQSHVAAMRTRAQLGVAGEPLAAAQLIQGGISAGIVAGTAIAETISGSKAVGGNASAFNNYRVNEQGAELLSMGGEDYLMMGAQQGSITPANQLGGGDVVVQPKINIINQTGSNIRQGQTSILSDGTVQIIIQEATERAVGTIDNRLEDGGNPTSDAIERNYNLSRAV